MKRCLLMLVFAAVPNLTLSGLAGEMGEANTNTTTWPQWRGPTRDGQISGPAWPDRLTKESLTPMWRLPL